MSKKTKPSEAAALAGAVAAVGEYLSLRQVARVLGVSRKTLVKRIIRGGLLRAKALYWNDDGSPGPLRVLRTDFEAYQEQVARGTAPREDAA